MISDVGSISFAYLDGGSGSLLVQAVIAGALTSLYFVKTQWHTILGLFRKKSK
jgi:hypothetical protein